MQREEPRLALPLPIFVEWKNEKGNPVCVKAWTKNISYQGLCLVLNSASLTTGSRIELSANHYHLSTTGVVCYLERKEDGSLLVGVKLDKPLFGWLARYRICSKNLLANFVPTI